MPDEEKQGGSVTEIAKVVGTIVDKVPVYGDALQPAAKEIGKGLEIVARAVHSALLPLEVFIWGMDQIKGFVQTQVAEKLRDVPPENIQPPAPHVAVPAIEALRYTGADRDLSELYANLLASSMDRTTAARAHPAFVDMIKNMSPDEARLMRYLAVSGAVPIVEVRSFSKADKSYRIVIRYATTLATHAGCEHRGLLGAYLDNLERLGLIEIDRTNQLADTAAYSEVEEHPEVKGVLATIEKESPERTGHIVKMSLRVTSLGRQFIDACVVDRTQVRG